MFILLLVCSFIFSLLLQLFFKRSLRKKRERNVSLANNSWVGTQFKLWILEILLKVCGDFLMASGTRQPEYFFYCNILLQPWSQALGDVILFAFCSIPPLLTKKFYLTQIRTLPFSFATLKGGWVGVLTFTLLVVRLWFHVYLAHFSKKIGHGCGKVKRLQKTSCNLSVALICWLAHIDFISPEEQQRSELLEEQLRETTQDALKQRNGKKYFCCVRQKIFKSSPRTTLMCSRQSSGPSKISPAISFPRWLRE